MNNNGDVLVDTSAWILSFSKRLPKSKLEEFRVLLTEGKVATTSIIILELLGGARTEKDFQELREDMEALQQLPIIKEVWHHSYRLSFELRRKGLNIPATDIIIASTALHYNALLLHHDKHFELIARYAPLRVKGVMV
ncbi:MAG: PIN domain nuclease [Candidatus Brocadiales bacterium]